MEPNEELAEAIIKRLVNGIPPCPNCGNTDRDFWAMDNFTYPYAIEICLVCGHERPILERKAQA